ncbi:HAD family hydrolase [Nitriliruptor alkaliphilus]|uniref:HAD family hydrolase n=1 Tax=Nitriliruptor alkaliphilus TaxID=427918 RepID=UPI0006969B5D|nr:HAD family hydrolase [Nitriliruptor alkaliphilus]
MRHVVWDWNGTLFDDQHLVLEGLHAVLAEAGLPAIDLATYQRLYTRPVKVFYERLFGRPIPADEWAHLDERYHDGYRAALHRAGLAADAERALDLVAEADSSQSLLSMWRHHELVPLVGQLGIEDRFVRIDGLQGPGGGNKAPHLEAHLTAVTHLTGDDPSQVLVIGDALDDAAAAAHVGARCVLFDGGSHPRAELETAGVPVASSLVEALDRAYG